MQSYLQRLYNFKKLTDQDFFTFKIEKGKSENFLLINL